MKPTSFRNSTLKLRVQQIRINSVSIDETSLVFIGQSRGNEVDKRFLGLFGVVRNPRLLLPAR